MTPSNLNSIIEKMENEIDADYFIGVMDNCMQEIEESGIEAVEPLLQFMERHPLSDFGSPGSIVHFVETFYKQGYRRRNKKISSRPFVLINEKL